MLNSTRSESIRSGDEHLAATLNSTRSADQSGAAPLASAAIARALALKWRGACAVEAVAVTGSTNADLVLRARAQQPPECLLRAADFQSNGRGRQQRRWHAACGEGLLFSLAIPLAGAARSLPAITLACGVVLAECLIERGISVQLKWPNDIRIEGRKLGGILTELVADRDARHTLVIGVGINWHLDDAMCRLIEQPAIALDQLLATSVSQPREHWIGCFGGAIFAAAAQFVRDGFDPFRARFNQLLESRGALVEVQGDGARVVPIRGRVIEVDQQGRLIIEAEGRRHAVSVGDVSVRQ